MSFEVSDDCGVHLNGPARQLGVVVDRDRSAALDLKVDSREQAPACALVEQSDGVAIGDGIATGTFNEQAATHAADGYARATGKPGVVLVTSGPGATNAITGIATAYMDSIPLVVISGQVQSHLIGEDAFQETDMVGISRPIVKHSFLVQKVEAELFLKNC